MAIFIQILLTSIFLVNGISAFTYYDLHPDDEKKTADNLIGNLVDQVVSWTFVSFSFSFRVTVIFIQSYIQIFIDLFLINYCNFIIFSRLIYT